VFSVILEYPNGQRRVYSEHRVEAEAQAVAWRCAEGYHDRAKVFVKSPGSGDQIQITAKGRVVRDQPDLPAVGEHKIVRVPIARMTLSAKSPEAR
jgi:hypothetical protein